MKKAGAYLALAGGVIVAVSGVAACFKSSVFVYNAVTTVPVIKDAIAADETKLADHEIRLRVQESKTDFIVSGMEELVGRKYHGNADQPRRSSHGR